MIACRARVKLLQLRNDRRLRVYCEHPELPSGMVSDLRSFRGLCVPDDVGVEIGRADGCFLGMGDDMSRSGGRPMAIRAGTLTHR